MPKYFLAIKHFPDSPPEFREVDGEPVTIPRAEAFKFFFHHPMEKTFADTEYWQITEATTGRSMTGRCSTREIAVQLVAETIKKKGSGALQEAIAIALALPENRSPWQSVSEAKGDNLHERTNND